MSRRVRASAGALSKFEITRAFALAALAGWLVAAAYLPATAAEKSFTVATFNAWWLTRKNVHVRFGNPLKLDSEGRKKWDAPNYRNERFAEATERVAIYIAHNISADVLVVTEVGDKRDVRELRDRLEEEGAGYPYVEVCACTDRRSAQHVAVLSRIPLFDVLRELPGREGYLTELDDPEAEKHTGISKGMQVRFRAADKIFRLYAVHFTSERGGYERDAQRIAQASILRRLTLRPLNAGEHVIVAGDLNDRRGDPTLRRARGLDDIWPDLVQTGRAKYFKDDGERWTYRFKGQREQIDHILLSQSIVQAVFPRKGIRAETGPVPDRNVSDHRPLIVKLTFPVAPR